MCHSVESRAQQEVEVIPHIVEQHLINVVFPLDLRGNSNDLTYNLIAEPV